ncbi:MAG: hypothetical protein ACTHOU_04210 [Aureliella sp.]|jgi:hypothetical protein
MTNRHQICEQMAAVRSRGLVNAREFGEEVERLADWREHVRAHPIPLVLAAAAVGYFAIPSKRKVVKEAASPLVSVGEDKSKPTTGMAGLLLGFATSLAGNAIRSYVSQQVQSLVQGKDDHATFVQRQASAHRY